MRSILKKRSAYYFKSLTKTIKYNGSEATPLDSGSNHGHESKPKHEVQGHGDHHPHQPVASRDKPFYPGDIAEKDYDVFNDIFQRPIIEESKYALHNIIATNVLTKRKGFLAFLQENIADGKTEEPAEYYRPPKIHENSVFIYQSRGLANTYRFERASEYMLAFLVLGVMHEPTWIIPTYGLFYVLYGRAGIYEKSRRFVNRMDLLPHLDMVHFQKTTAFGQVYSSLVRTSDLEYVDFEEIRDSENWFWGINANLDKYLVFRDKKTKEVFVFDRDGFWDVKGLEHELLN